MGGGGEKYCFALGDICGSIQRSGKLQKSKDKKSIAYNLSMLLDWAIAHTTPIQSIWDINTMLKRQYGLPCCPGPVLPAVAVSEILSSWKSSL